MLAEGAPGRPRIRHPAASVLLSTDEVLAGYRPPRARQLAQKLVLTEGPREIAGLLLAYAGAHAQGYRRGGVSTAYDDKK
jgi:hypothetical protein